MLSELFIRNVAVIQKARIPFGEGFNVITGETGAGKTMLISSIDAVLGERTSREIIRAGEEKAVITAMFTGISSKAKQALANLGCDDEEDMVVVTREISASGKSICRINEMPVTAGTLKEIAPMLIHVHGQRDGQQLLDHEKHLDLIDLFCQNKSLLDDYLLSYQEMAAVTRKLGQMQMSETEKEKRIEMLRFQIEEIESAELEDPEEEEALISQKRVILGGEKVRDGLAKAYQGFQGDDDLIGALGLFEEIQQGVGDVAMVLDSFGDMSVRLEEIGYELSEFAAEIRQALDDFEFDPAELEQIERRLDLVYRLKKKYGASIDAILEYYGQAVEELDRLESSERSLAMLENQLAMLKEVCLGKAKLLSENRQEGSAQLIAMVEAELAFLDMPQVKLSIKHRETSPGPAGIDVMEFYIVTNAGEEPKPLNRIASGGELARIMLSFKNVLAGRDGVDTLIFDEVDSGVSGRAAGRIGEKLHQASRARQVICVTHLAQVAAYADSHFLIHKNVENGRTFTEVKPLGHEGAIAELARISSADVVTEKSLESARELWLHAHGRSNAT